MVAIGAASALLLAFANMPTSAMAQVSNVETAEIAAFLVAGDEQAVSIRIFAINRGYNIAPDTDRMGVRQATDLLKGCQVASGVGTPESNVRINCNDGAERAPCPGVYDLSLTRNGVLFLNIIYVYPEPGERSNCLPGVPPAVRRN